MLSKLIVIAFILISVFCKNIAHGVTLPSALDIYNQVYTLQPGANVGVAYDLLGVPHETSDMPPMFLWFPAPNSAIIISLLNNTIIENSGYKEIYEEMHLARQRYRELKEEFFEILGAAVKEFELGTAWLVENYFFTLDYEEVNDNFGQRTNVTVLFLAQ